VTNRAYDTDNVANIFLAQFAESLPDNLEQDFDPSFICVGSHNRQRSSHWNRLIALDVREATCSCARRAFRCMYTHNELVASVLPYIDDRRVFYEDCAAICLRASDHRR
jgi:hypothetical protein